MIAATGTASMAGNRLGYNVDINSTESEEPRHGAGLLNGETQALACANSIRHSSPRTERGILALFVIG